MFNPKTASAKVDKSEILELIERLANDDDVANTDALAQEADIAFGLSIKGAQEAERDWLAQEQEICCAVGGVQEAESEFLAYDALKSISHP